MTPKQRGIATDPKSLLTGGLGKLRTATTASPQRAKIRSYAPCIRLYDASSPASSQSNE